MTTRYIKRWLTALALVVVLFVAFLVYQEWQRQRHIDNVKTFSDILEPISKDENDAAVYLQAHREFEIVSAATGEETETALRQLLQSSSCPCKLQFKHRNYSAPLDNLSVQLISQYMAASEPAFKLLRSDRLERARFLSYTEPSKIYLDAAIERQIYNVANVARQMSYRALWDVHRGQHDEAVQWIERTFRLSNQLSDDPVWRAFYGRVLISGMGFDALNEVLCTTASVTIPQSLVQELKRIQDREQYAALFQSELILSKIEREEALTNAGSLQSFFTTAFFLDRGDEDVLRAQEATLEDNYAVRDQMVAALRPRDSILPDWALEIVGEIWPTTHGKSHQALALAGMVDELIAAAGTAEVAIYLARYKAAYGQYPSSLTALVPEFATDLPSDPFSGKSFVYESSADSFELYSVGPDDWSGAYAFFGLTSYWTNWFDGEWVQCASPRSVQ